LFPWNSSVPASQELNRGSVLGVSAVSLCVGFNEGSVTWFRHVVECLYVRVVTRGSTVSWVIA